MTIKTYIFDTFWHRNPNSALKNNKIMKKIDLDAKIWHWEIKMVTNSELKLFNSNFFIKSFFKWIVPPSTRLISNSKDTQVPSACSRFNDEFISTTDNRYLRLGPISHLKKTPSMSLHLAPFIRPLLPLTIIPLNSLMFPSAASIDFFKLILIQSINST